MDKLDIEFEHVSICTHHETEDENELANFVEYIQQVEYPNFLPNKEIYVDPSDIDEFELRLSNTSLSNEYYSEGSELLCEIISEENNIHVHSYAEAEMLEEIAEFHQQIVSYFNQLDKTSLWFTFESEMAVERPKFSLEGLGLGKVSEEISLVGVERDDANISVRYDEDSVILSYAYKGIKDLATNEFNEAVNEKLDESYVNMESQ